MSANASAAALLATVERSPQAVAVHDRAAWVDLFAPDGRVEDPVGSQPHRGLGAIGAFFDTFIGPRHITYRPDADIVAGSTVVVNAVVGGAIGFLDWPAWIALFTCFDVGDRRYRTAAGAIRNSDS